MSCRRSNRGFTLVELLLVIVIMGVITTALVNAVITATRGTTDVTTAMGQSSAAQQINRYLTGDIQEANGVVYVNTSDSSCGGVAPLKLLSRSVASAASTDTTTVWVLSGTDIVRRTCVGAATDSYTVAHGISSFTPAACASPCNAATITVTVTAAGSSKVNPYTWSLTVKRRDP